jgi:protein gp37
MSDTFHADVPDHTIRMAFDVMRKANHHIFQILTKRPERMASFLLNVYPEYVGPGVWPEEFPHVWLGTTVEDQDAADVRINHLMNTPAKIRFLSCEPLLEEVILALRVDKDGRDVTGLNGLHDEGDRRINWVIVGAESGHGGRHMYPHWVRSIRDQCAGECVAFFYKQRVKDGKKITMPELDGVVHNALPMEGIRGHKIEKQMNLISSEETE